MEMETSASQMSETNTCLLLSWWHSMGIIELHRWQLHIAQARWKLEPIN